MKNAEDHSEHRVRGIENPEVSGFRRLSFERRTLNIERQTRVSMADL